MQNKSKHMGGQCCSLVQLDCIHLQGPGGGKGNRRFMSSCDTRCSGSHVNGK